MHTDFINEIIKACERAFFVLGVSDLKFRPMRRRKPVNPKKGYVLGRTNLKTGLITIDVLTAVKREPKKVSAILRILCHEIAHHQKRPFLARYKRKIITRQHYPEFYKQVNENVERLRGDGELGKYF